MKKLFFTISILALGALTFSACTENEDIEETPEAVTADDLAGVWTIDGRDGEQTVSFTQKEVTVTRYDYQEYSGSYTLADGEVSFGGYRSTGGLLYDKSVLVMQYEETEDGSDALAMILFKKDKKVTATIDDIQGTWDWYSDFGDLKWIIRARLRLQDNKFELTITPWGQKYIGTFTYKDGIIHLNVLDGLTSREEHSGNGELWGSMDPQTLEAEWNTLDRENWSIDTDMEIPFITNGDKAYGYIVGLTATFTKEK